ncbi:MAG: nucleotide exchange factor GrpE [Firmicutes bacterium]|nr:nucleotide exchange factor GrpE [Bacillota bacterium]
MDAESFRDELKDEGVDTEKSNPVEEMEEGAAEPSVAEELPETHWEEIAQDRYDQLVRLQADFENFRRRMDRERDEIKAYVVGSLLSDLLPVYDNLERALKFMPSDGEAKSWRVGLEMTLNGFNEALARQGVEAIETEGQMFDPRYHEAVQRVESDLPEGTIVEELMRGFRWKERVLRASMVKVSEGPEPQ